jgi:hypothetical protein
MLRVTAAVCVAPLFLFQPDNFWLNLHQFLYVLGRHEAAMPDRTRRATVGAPADAEKGLAGLSADEHRAWKEAVTLYANGLSRQDAVFDDPVITAAQGLVQAAGASSLTMIGLAPTLAAMLEKAAPIYRKAWWPAHQRANVAWVRETEAQVEQHGAAITQFITRAYGLPWPEAGYPIQVSAYANWAGAFSTRGNLLIISSLDAGNRGLTGLEITFHEAMHQWDDAVDAALARQAVPLSMRVPDPLSHALIFYTAGEAVRSIAAAHVPYAEANSVWKQKGLGQFKSALEEVWKPYLDGKGTRDQALAEILKRVGSKGKVRNEGSAQEVRGNLNSL